MKNDHRFGYGNHVCPGRFLAVRLIKIIFTKVITEYDFWWDRKGPGQPRRFEFEGTAIPNPLQKIWLKKRGEGKKEGLRMCTDDKTSETLEY